MDLQNLDVKSSEFPVHTPEGMLHNNSKHNQCKSQKRRWEGSLEGGWRMALSCLGTASSGMEAHNGLIHPHTNNILTFHCCDWATCVSSTHQHHCGIFNPFFLQVGRCQSARPSSNPSLATLSKITVTLTQGRKSSVCFAFPFCFGTWLRFCYVTKADSFSHVWRLLPVLNLFLTAL